MCFNLADFSGLSTLGLGQQDVVHASKHVAEEAEKGSSTSTWTKHHKSQLRALLGSYSHLDSVQRAPVPAARVPLAAPALVAARRLRHLLARNATAEWSGNTIAKRLRLDNRCYMAPLWVRGHH